MTARSPRIIVLIDNPGCALGRTGNKGNSAMQRRDFIKSVAAAGTIAAVGRRAHAAAKGWREFEITTRVDLKDSATAVRLWLPVPQDALDYQRVIDLSWRSPVAS